jgi:hypothetical protein
MHRALLAVLLLSACESAKAREERQITECVREYGDAAGGAVESCLVNRFRWDSSAALAADLTHQRTRAGH